MKKHDLFSRDYLSRFGSVETPPPGTDFQTTATNSLPRSSRSHLNRQTIVVKICFQNSVF